MMTVPCHSARSRALQLATRERMQASSAQLRELRAQVITADLLRQACPVHGKGCPSCEAVDAEVNHLDQLAIIVASFPSDS